MGSPRQWKPVRWQNSFKSSQSNVQYKKIKSQLVCGHPIAILLVFVVWMSPVSVNALSVIIISSKFQKNIYLLCSLTGYSYYGNSTINFSFFYQKLRTDHHIYGDIYFFQFSEWIYLQNVQEAKKVLVMVGGNVRYARNSECLAILYIK